MTRAIVASVLLILITSACGGGGTLSTEDRQILDRAKAREKARADLLATPSRFIEGGRWDLYDKGIINSYTRATAVEFTNRTEFDVSEIQGKITYFGEKGEELATVPFTADGNLRAGETKKLNVTAGEVTGRARQGRTVVEKLRILGG